MYQHRPCNSSYGTDFDNSEIARPLDAAVPSSQASGVVGQSLSNFRASTVNPSAPQKP